MSKEIRRVETKLAEREGFEPSRRLPACGLSKAVHSTTLPPLRCLEALGLLSFYYYSTPRVLSTAE